MTNPSSQLFRESPKKVFAVYSHPDDADVACGGTLARWILEGCEVHLLLLTDGGKGTSDPSVPSVELVARRRLEVATAAEAIGITEIERLDLADGDVAEFTDLRELLVRRIRSLKPDVVLSHDPTAVFFGSVYVNHQDHRAAGWAVLDAVAPASALPHYFPEAGDPYRVPSILLSGTLEPDAYVDITSTIDAKTAAVAAHLSQLHGDLDWVNESILQQAADDGRKVGVAYAEGFRLLNLNG